jgi:group I intron endonuclease
MHGIIYKATNLFNGKCYIGQTKNGLKNRSKKHLRDSLKNNSDCYFHRAIRKYSNENFSWDVISEANTKEELHKLERFWISYFKSNNPKHGYNMTEGGEGGSLNKEVKIKIAISNTGKKHTKEAKMKVSIKNKGKIAWNKGLTKESDERVKKYGRSISKKQKGKKLEKSHKENIGNSIKGRVLSTQHKENIGKSNRGKKRTKEQIKKMSNSLRGRTPYNKIQVDYNFIIDCYFKNMIIKEITENCNKKYNLNMCKGVIKRVLKELGFPNAANNATKEKKLIKENFINNNKPEDFYK